MGRLVRVLLVLAVVFAAAAGDDKGSLEDLRALIGQGQYAEAEVGARERLAAAEAESGPESAAAAEVLDVLVESRWRAGKIGEPETLELANRAIEIKTRALGADHASVAESLNNLAVISYFAGDYRQARSLWERALAIRLAKLSADDPKLAQTQNNLANLLQAIGDYDAALPLYRSALETREKALGPDDPAVADSLNNLGVLIASRGDYANARTILQRAIEIKKKALGPDHPKVASSMNSLAFVLDAIGDYDGERELLEEARRIWEAALGPDHPRVGTVLNNLGEAARKSGDHDAARRYYDQSIENFTAALGPDHPLVALSLDNKADLLKAMGEFAESRQLYERALAIREAALGSAHPEVAESLTSLAVLLSDRGNLKEARPLLERAVVIREESLGYEHPSVAESKNALAILLTAEGDRAAALELALESERIARDHLRLTGRSLSETQALQYASIRNRGLDLALSLAESTSDPASRRRVLDSLTRSRAVVLDEMAARQRAVSGSEDPRVVRLAEELTSARARLANLTVSGLDGMELEEYQLLLEDARDEKERAESALAEASVLFAREQRRGKLGLEEVASSLPEGSALVSFAVHDRTMVSGGNEEAEGAEATTGPSIELVPSYVALILGTGQANPTVVSLGPVERIDALVGKWKTEAATGAMRFRKSPTEAEKRYVAVATDLRRAVWDPLARHLQEVRRVFIVPDGALNLVSFAALPLDEESYLIETGPTVHYLSAERDLVATSDSEAAAGVGLLALGGPDYDDQSIFSATPETGDTRTRRAGESTRTTTTRSSCGNFDTLSFDPLPAAAVEAQDVVTLWERADETDGPTSGAVVHLAGPAASEAALKSSAPGKRVLHLATHGFFLGGDCTSGIERIRGSRGLNLVQEPEPAPVEGLSPLLLSGLALAGANHRDLADVGQEDGILTAEEIASLDLSGVEWAVLSACDTGVGEVRAGEGVFGLRRAIQVAGVRTLIMSLWPVDDEATRSWMHSLYEGRLLRGLDSAEAVRAAGLAVIEQRREAGESSHPFYWAAFVAAGQWQ